MNRFPFVLGLLALVVFTAAGCRSTNRLAQYDFRDRTVAVTSNLPPHPDVFSSDWLDVDPENLLATVARVGSQVVKEVQAEKARARLADASREVDVSDRIAGRVRDGSARYLRAQPVDEAHTADYLIDIRVRKYGIEASSWRSRAYFKLDADVLLLDGEGRQVWKTRVKERDPISPTLFAGTTVTNLVTAEALSRLSVEEMVVAMEQMADYAADRINVRLQHDLARARR